MLSVIWHLATVNSLLPKIYQLEEESFHQLLYFRKRLLIKAVV